MIIGRDVPAISLRVRCTEGTELDCEVDRSGPCRPLDAERQLHGIVCVNIGQRHMNHTFQPWAPPSHLTDFIQVNHVEQLPILLHF